MSFSISLSMVKSSVHIWMSKELRDKIQSAYDQKKDIKNFETKYLDSKSQFTCRLLDYALDQLRG